MKYKVNLSRSELENLIDDWILNDRDNAITKMRFRGYTYEQIAEKMEMSTRQIARIVPKQIEYLMEHGLNVM